MSHFTRRQLIGSIPGLLTIPCPDLLQAAPVEWRFQATHGALRILADYRPNLEGQLAQLASLRSDLKRVLELRVGEQPVYLQLFQNRESMRRQLDRLYPGSPDRRALYVRSGGRATIFARRGPSLELDLRHELTHALLHQVVPSLPLWLDEGLAEYFEQPRGGRDSRSDYLGEIGEQIRQGRIIVPADLEEVVKLDAMSADHYRFAWGWVHFMLHHSSPAREELVRYLADIRAGIPAGRLGRRLAQRLGRLDTLFRGHFRNWT